MEITLKQNNKLFYGWWNVTSAFIGLSLSYAMFTIFSFGSFVVALEVEFGWSRHDLAMGLTIANITVVFVSPLLGSIIDKYGARQILSISIPLMGICVAAMSQLDPHLWQFHLLYLLIPLFDAGTLPLTYSRVIIAWFSRKRG